MANKVTGSRFHRQAIHIDEAEYHECIFEECEIIYSGRPFHLEGCEFRNCSYTLVEAAENTIGYMIGMYQMGPATAKIVEDTFANIRRAGGRKQGDTN